MLAKFSGYTVMYIVPTMYSHTCTYMYNYIYRYVGWEVVPELSSLFIAIIIIQFFIHNNICKRTKHNSFLHCPTSHPTYTGNYTLYVHV